jgi:hypothetical protein
VSSVARYFEKKAGREASSDELKWSALLDRYQFSNMDEFDRELMKFVASGVLDGAGISKAAIEQNDKLKRLKTSNSLEQAWRPLHDSFENNLPEVRRSVVDGMKASLGIVSISQLNSAVGVLKELDQGSAVNEVVAFYVANAPPSFWNHVNDPFQNPFQSGPLHPEIAAVVQTQIEKSTVPFDPEAALIEAAQTYDHELIHRLAQVPVETYHEMVKAKRGADMRKIIWSALEFKRIANASQEMRQVIQRMEEALRRIGSESTLNAIRVKRYGVSVPDEDLADD